MRYFNVKGKSEFSKIIFALASPAGTLVANDSIRGTQMNPRIHTFESLRFPIILIHLQSVCPCFHFAM